MRTNRFINPGRRGGERAFTLAEVMIAAAIVGLLFASLFASIAFSFNSTRFNREDLRATQVLVERMEGLRLFNWSQLTNTTLNPTTFTNTYYPNGLSSGSVGITYTGTMMVTNAVLTPSPTYSDRLKTITVTIRWTSVGVPRFRTLTTLVAQDGMQNYIYDN